MSKSPGLLFNVNDVMKGCGYADSERDATFQMLSKFARDGKLERFASGVFVYRGSNTKTIEQPQSTMYEYIGKLDDGSIIMRNENNGLERFTKGG